jgi:hypothetical protein
MLTGSQYMLTVYLVMVNVFMIMPIAFLGILSSSINMAWVSQVMVTGSQDMLTVRQRHVNIVQLLSKCSVHFLKKVPNCAHMLFDILQHYLGVEPHKSDL